MSDISKTRYRLLDEINNTVTIFGFEVKIFMYLLLGYMFFGFIIYLILGLIGLTFIFLSLIFLSNLGKKMKTLRSKGVKDPLYMMLTYKSKPFYFRNNIDIKSIYENSREQ